MANIKSAKKAIRVTKRKRKINLVKIDAFKEARKKVSDLLKSGDVKGAEKELPKAYKAIDKAGKTNTIHKNTASRYKSRLAKKVLQAKKAEKAKKASK